MKKIIIAMDGHSSCGKSTMAKTLAKKIGYTYIDTGAMYRAVTLYAMRRGFIGKNGIDEESLRKELPLIKISFGHENGEQYTILNGENVERQIRGMEVSGNVSPISAIGFVREAMVELQREMGKKGAVIMDGRDIGTTVFPNAELKIFVTATDEIRARRRYDELILKGDNPVYEDVLKNVRERDYIDSHRAVSPLRQADDAIVLDNSGMSYQEQDDWLMEQYLKAAKD
ncbi:MAG: (d)CMP kinase [Bacteroidaceae bacterium]|nr:(d)CMP kinase [Bacteroidaceae bacterium]MBR4595063.1 (d)CMP kinase [Bacteroidaceae bacterium]